MLISVIIPCYNVEKYIIECITSVRSQSYPDIEIICIDDGSTDRTAALLASQSEYITLLYSPRKGAAYARNRGIDIAKGAYIQFLDADDLLLPDKISSNVQVIEAASKTQTGTGTEKYMVIGRHIHVRPNGERQHYSYHNDQWTSIIAFSWGHTCCNLWSAQLVREVGGFNENLSCYQDGDILFRIALLCQNILYDPGYNTIIRERPGSISTTKDNPQQNEQRLINSLSIRNNMKAYLMSVNKYTKLYQQVLAHHIFLHIKDLAHSDIEKATTYHNQHIPRGFTPNVAGLSYIYILNYKLGGFRFAEKIARRIHKIKGRL